MNDQVNQLTLEIKEIYGQYLAEVGEGGYKVWPKSIRDRTLLLSGLVGSCKKAAELSGLSVETIYQWRAEVKKSQFKSIAVVEKKSKTVTVTEPVLKAPVDQKLVTVTVTTPGGYKVEGHSDDVLKILKVLGRS
jgi:transposase